MGRLGIKQLSHGFLLVQCPALGIGLNVDKTNHTNTHNKIGFQNSSEDTPEFITVMQHSKPSKYGYFSLLD